MLTTSFSLNTFSSYASNLFNGDLLLSVRLREGRCIPYDDIERLSLILRKDGHVFFENPLVQYNLLHGILHRKITDPDIPYVLNTYESSIAAVDAFLARLSPEAKQIVLPRLAVLLGTMAKKGVLGYHHGDINQANTLLYLLASHCFYQLRETAGIVFQDNFHEELNQGVCMEALTNKFIFANHNIFRDVFATRSN